MNDLKWSGNVQLLGTVVVQVRFLCNSYIFRVKEGLMGSGGLPPRNMGDIPQTLNIGGGQAPRPPI